MSHAARRAKSAAKFANGMSEADQYFSRATEAKTAGNQNLSDLWTQAAQKVKTATESYAEADKARVAGNHEEVGRLNKAGKLADQEKSIFIKMIPQIAHCLSKAEEAKIIGNHEEVNLWTQEAMKMQGLSNEDTEEVPLEEKEDREAIVKEPIHQASVIAASGTLKRIAQAAKKYQEVRSTVLASSGNKAKVWQDCVANNLEKASVYWRKAYKAEKEGKVTLVAGYGEAATTYEKAADCFQESGGAFWEKQKSFQAKAEYQVKACEAEEAGEKQLAASYREAIAIFQQIASAIEKQEKAIQKEKAAKSVVAQKWKEVTEQQAHAVEYLTKAAKACAEGKTKKSDSWNKIGKGFYYAAIELEKAIEAEATGESAVAQKYREEGEKQLRRVEFIAQLELKMENVDEG